MATSDSSGNYTGYSTNRLHNGSYLCYINGIEVPVQSVSVRYGVWQIPEATIEMVPDPVIQRIGAEDRVQVAVFYCDDFLSTDDSDINWCLLFEGEIVSWGYQASSASRVMTLTAVNQIAIFTQLFIHYLTNLDNSVSAAVGMKENQTASFTVAESEITFPVSLFTHGLVSPGSATPITRPFEFMYNIVKSTIGKFDRNDLPTPVRETVRKQKSVPSANFFTRWARMCNFHNRFVATPVFDETGRNSVFPILEAFQKTVAIDTIIRNILPRVQESGSMWDMLRMVYETVFMELAMLPTAPMVQVELSDSTILPTPINAFGVESLDVISEDEATIDAALATKETELANTESGLEQTRAALTLLRSQVAEERRSTSVISTATLEVARKSTEILALEATEKLQVTAIETLHKEVADLKRRQKIAIEQGQPVYRPLTEYNPLRPWRLANYFSKPQLLFGLPPSCNVLFPSQITQYSYNENFATQPTRLYFNDTVLPDILRMDGNVRTTALSALALAYPPEADLYNKERIKNNQAGASGKNFLLFPEEFFKGPVEDRRVMPAWFFMLQSAEYTQTKNEADAAEAATVDAVTSRSANAGTALELQTTTTTSSVVKLGETKLEGPTRILRPYSLSTSVLNDSVLRKLISDRLPGTNIPLMFALAWVDQATQGNPRHDTGASGARQYHTEATLQQEPWVSINAADVTANRPMTFKVGDYIFNPELGQDALDAHGDFAITFDETKSMGLTAESHELILADRGHGVWVGLNLITKYYRQAKDLMQTYNLPWTGADEWKLTKALHTNSVGTVGVLTFVIDRLGRAPKSWNEFLETALAAAKYSPTVGIGGDKTYAPVEGYVWNDDMKRNSSWPLRLINADRVGSFATVTPEDAAKIASTSTAPIGPTSPETTRQAEGLISTGAVADEDKASTIYQLYAEYEFFRQKYAQRGGTVTLAFNPYVVPGFPGAVFDNRDSAVDIFCYFVGVQHTLTQRGHTTNITYTHGRTFSEVIDLLKAKFDAPIGTASMIAMAPREPIPEIRNVVQQFARAEEFYNALFYKRSDIEGKTASFWWTDIVGYENPTDPNIVIPIYIDGVTNGQAIDRDEQISKLGSERSVLMEQIAKGLDARNTLVQQQTTLNRAYSNTTDPVTREATLKAYADITGVIDNLDKLIKDRQARVAEIDSILNSTKIGLVRHNLDPTKTLVPETDAAAYFTDYDAAMYYNWRPVCTLEEYIAFYNSVGENLVPAHGTSVSVGKPYFERIRRMRPITADTPLPSGANGILLATFGSVTSQPAAQPPSSTAPNGEAGSVTGPVAQGLGNDFPQTRSDWDAALLAYRDNVYNISVPRR